MCLLKNIYIFNVCRPLSVIIDSERRHVEISILGYEKDRIS